MRRVVDGDELGAAWDDKGRTGADGGASIFFPLRLSRQGVNASSTLIHPRRTSLLRPTSQLCRERSLPTHGPLPRWR